MTADDRKTLEELLHWIRYMHAEGYRNNAKAIAALERLLEESQ